MHRPHLIDPNRHHAFRVLGIGCLLVCMGALAATAFAHDRVTWSVIVVNFSAAASIWLRNARRRARADRCAGSPR